MNGQPLAAPPVPEPLRLARLERHAWDRGIPLVAGGLDDQPFDRLLRMLNLTGGWED